MVSGTALRSEELNARVAIHPCGEVYRDFLIKIPPRTQRGGVLHETCPAAEFGLANRVAGFPRLIRCEPHWDYLTASAVNFAPRELLPLLVLASQRSAAFSISAFQVSAFLFCRPHRCARVDKEVTASGEDRSFDGRHNNDDTNR